MKIDHLKSIFSEFGDNVKFYHDLKKKNWFNIGGKSKVFYKAENLKELINFLKKLDNKEKLFIIGAGSNILVNDNTFDGVVIKLGKNFNIISLLGEDIIIAGSSVLDIPGTIGGGIRMNAGCFGKEFKDILISIQAIDRRGNVITIQSKDINFEYRKSDLSNDLIFLSASFKGFKKQSEKIKKEMDRIKLEKDINQPSKIKTSGSTFKNPISQTERKVWELIKESVSLDQNFGDACISEKHCNFFVNKGNATFKDMNKLINFVSKKVYEKTGISLEKEIKILE